MKMILFILGFGFLASANSFNLFKNTKNEEHVAKPQNKLLAVVIDG